MPSDFLPVFINISYYLCFVPFRVKTSTDGVHRIHTCFLQKILCGAEHLLAMFLYGTSMRYAVEGMSTGTATTFFRLFENCFCIFYKVLVLKCFWGKQDVILKILNFPHSRIQYGPEEKRKKEVKRWIIISSVYVVYIMQPILRMTNPTANPLSQVPVRNEENDTNVFSTWYKCLIMEARYVFFFQHVNPLEQQELIYATYSPMEAFQASAIVVALFSKYLMGSFCDLAVLTFILRLWTEVVNFVKVLRVTGTGQGEVNDELTIVSTSEEDIRERGKDDGKVIEWEEERRKEETCMIINEYHSLRKLTQLINEVIGNSLIPLIGEGIFTYAINFKDIFFLGTLSRGIVVFSFYAIFLAILILASSICSQMQSMKEWLYEHEQDLTLSSRQLSLLLDSISHNSVGIALSGILTINYSLVGTLSSVVVTYFIVRLQSTE